VLVGLWTHSVKDYINSPLRESGKRDFGVTCHARIADQLIRAANGQPAFTRVWSARTEAASIIGFCLLGGALGWAVRPPWRVFAGTSAIVVVTAAATLVLTVLYTSARSAFDRGLWIPVIPPAVGFIACTAMVGLYTGVRGRQDRNAMMTLISGFVSDDVAKLIWSDRNEVFTSGGLRPRRQRATMLFTDLKGFASIAEKMNASELMTWLNEYFERITDLVKENRGLIMKFNGDQIVAVFGPPRNRTKEQAGKDARNAVTCALQMRGRLRELNMEWLARGRPQAMMRIGIHTGVLVAGSLGSRKRQEWTVIGHTVNIAARLESVRKDLMPPDVAADGCRIFLSDKTAKHLDMSIDTRRVGRMALKGIKRRVTVHGVIGWAIGAQVRSKTAINKNPVQARKQP
jgi:adenylate cyclase